VFTISVTIPEGSNIFDIAARVEAAQLGSERGVRSERRMHDGALVSDLDPRRFRWRGICFPDTYQFGRRTTQNRW
jgi:UPF0755 protein